MASPWTTPFLMMRMYNRDGSVTCFTPQARNLLSWNSITALGPEVITVCLHTDSNEPMENYSGTLSDHSTFDIWTCLLSFMILMISTQLLKTTGGRQDNPTTRASWFSNPHRNVTLSSTLPINMAIL